MESLFLCETKAASIWVMHASGNLYSSEGDVVTNASNHRRDCYLLNGNERSKVWGATNFSFSVTSLITYIRRYIMNIQPQQYPPQRSLNGPDSSRTCRRRYNALLIKTRGLDEVKRIQCEKIV